MKLGAFLCLLLLFNANTRSIDITTATKVSILRVRFFTVSLDSMLHSLWHVAPAELVQLVQLLTDVAIHRRRRRGRDASSSASRRRRASYV